MSFFTALLSGFGGYGQGRYNRAQLQLQQQDEADRQRQSQIQQAQWQTTAQQLLANRGIDPSTAHWDPATQSYVGGTGFVMPKELQRVVPHPVGPKYQVTPMDIYAHQNALADYFLRTGQTDRASMASQQAGDIYKQVLANQSQEAMFNRAVALEGLRAQDAATRQQAGFANTRALYDQYGRWSPLSMEEAQNLQLYGRTQPSAGAGGKAATPAQIFEAQAVRDNSKVAFQKAWATATDDAKTNQLGLPIAPAIPKSFQGDNDVRGKAGKLFSMIDSSNDPAAKVQELISHPAKNPTYRMLLSNPTIRALMEERARGRDYELKIKAMQQPAAAGGGMPMIDPSTGQPVSYEGGGSYDTSNPQKTTYSFPQLAAAWVKNGGDPRFAWLMAHVAEAESSGFGGATNHYTENGKGYVVRGPWQISSIHGGGNEEYNIDANARRAVELFNSQGLEPWKASYPTWGPYLHMMGGG